MLPFRSLTDRMDEAIFVHCADDAVLDGRPVRGLFAAPWLAPKIGTLGTGIVEPQLTVRDADAAGVRRGTVVEISGARYDIVSIEPDGAGVTVLVLRPQ
ncbi:MAG: hypothetical protein FWD77_01615 [Betaproteobacteria bacterium]|nr:hypothetical protein [Betaproteobacteria bacterium]